MKINDFLVPSNYVSLKFRSVVFVFIAFLWGFLLFLKYSVYHVDGALHFSGLYFLWVFWSFLFDKAIPTAPISMQFDKVRFSIILMRAFAGVAAFFILFLIMFFADW